MSLDPVFVAEFAQAGFLAADPEGHGRRLHRGHRAAARSTPSTWKDQLVAAPFWANTQLLWYRKSVAAEGRSRHDQAGHLGAADQGGQGTRTRRSACRATATRATWSGSTPSSRAPAARSSRTRRAPARPAQARPRHPGRQGRRDRDQRGGQARVSAARRCRPRTRRRPARCSRATPAASWSTGRTSGRPPTTRPRTSSPRHRLGALPADRGGRGSPSPRSAASRSASARPARSTTSPSRRPSASPRSSRRSSYMVNSGNPAAARRAYDDPEVRKAFPMADVIRESLDSAAPRPITPYYGDVSSARHRRVPPAGVGQPRLHPGADAEDPRRGPEGRQAAVSAVADPGRAGGHDDRHRRRRKPDVTDRARPGTRPRLDARRPRRSS